MAVRIGIVGAGLFSQAAHIANFTSIEGCEVVALADMRPNLLKLVADKYNIVGRHINHREMLAKEWIDAVVVCVDRQSLGQVSHDCLAAHKHVLSEKPMAQDSGRAQMLVDLAAEVGVRYIVGMMRRHDKFIELNRKVLKDREESLDVAPQLVRAWCYQGRFGLPPGIMTDEPKPIAPHQESGWLQFINVFIHNINLIRMFVQDPIKAVDARFNIDPVCGLALLSTPKFPIVLECAKAKDVRGWAEGIEIVYEESPTPITIGIQEPFETDCYRRQAEAFIASVATGAPNPCEGSDAVEDLKLAEAIWGVR